MFSTVEVKREVTGCMSCRLAYLLLRNFHRLKDVGVVLSRIELITSGEDSCRSVEVLRSVFIGMLHVKWRGVSQGWYRVIRIRAWSTLYVLADVTLIENGTTSKPTIRAPANSASTSE